MLVYEIISQIFPKIIKKDDDVYNSLIKDLINWNNWQYFVKIKVFSAYSIISFFYSLIEHKRVEFKCYWNQSGYSFIINDINRLKLSENLKNTIGIFSSGEEMIFDFNFSYKIINNNNKSNDICKYCLLYLGISLLIFAIQIDFRLLQMKYYLSLHLFHMNMWKTPY